MKYLPIPASTLKFTYTLILHTTVRPLLRLFAQSWRFPTISEYKWGTTEPLEHSSDQLIGFFIIPSHTVQKHSAKTAKRPLLSPRAAHDRRATTKPVRWVHQRVRLHCVAAAPLNGGRSEGGGRFTMVPCFSPLFFYRPKNRWRQGVSKLDTLHGTLEW